MTRLFAARGHDRRSPPVESQGDGRMPTGTGPETTTRPPLITSTAWQSRFNGRGKKVLFSQTEETKPVRQGGKRLTSPLRDGLELDAVVVHQATEPMSPSPLNAVERRTARVKPRGTCHVMGGMRSLRCATGSVRWRMRNVASTL